VDGLTLTAVAAAFFCGGVVKGMVGIGLPLTSIALLTLFLDLRIAVPLMVVPILATNILQSFRGGRFIELLRRYWLMLAGGAVGVWAGAAALYRVELSYLLISLGVVVCGYCLVNLLALRLKISHRSQPVLSPLIGALSGVLAGTTGSIGLPIIMYFQALGLSKDVFVQAIGIQFLINGAILAAALAYQNGLNAATLPISTLAVLPAFLGMAAGQWVRDRVSEERFRTALFVVLLLVGLNLIRKGLF
jgi:uncharacterized protein